MTDLVFPDPRHERFWLWKDPDTEFGVVDNFKLWDFWEEYREALERLSDETGRNLIWEYEAKEDYNREEM